MKDHEVTVEQEIANPSHGRPHVLLLGAGASRAALPNGDKYGREVPLLSEVADNLRLVDLFPDELKEVSVRDFEAAYSELCAQGPSEAIERIDLLVREYFSELELPKEPNLYDTMTLSLRDKDAIFTFNWDPFLIQSRIRMAKLGLTTSFPKIFFLHGNVRIGFCEKDGISGLIGQACSKCHGLFVPSKLLYPIKNKDYQSDNFINREWEAVKYYLKGCFMFTVFGYSAPTTDKEAIELLKEGWGKNDDREMEQTEIISHPGADVEQLRDRWGSFIHTHHYDVFESFHESFIAKHPRRSIEAYWNQYWEAKFISNHSVPETFVSFEEMTGWYQPLVEAEQAWKNK